MGVCMCTYSCVVGTAPLRRSHASLVIVLEFRPSMSGPARSAKVEAHVGRPMAIHVPRIPDRLSPRAATHYASRTRLDAAAETDEHHRRTSGRSGQLGAQQQSKLGLMYEATPHAISSAGSRFSPADVAGALSSIHPELGLTRALSRVVPCAVHKSSGGHPLAVGWLTCPFWPRPCWRGCGSCRSA